MGRVVARWLLVLLLFSTLPAQAALKVAVASNFKATLEKIVQQYEHQSGQKILISSGSTGTLYHQIRQGAPYDLFLSADSERAQLIEQSSVGINGSRFTYARGLLAFWSPRSPVAVDEATLRDVSGRVAIANPALAPYGLASQQALQTLGLWSSLSYVRGANISQTYQFIDTGNIAAGFVAYAQLLQNNASHYYLLPIDSYQPILQQGVMLARSQSVPELQAFVDFLQSADVVAMIQTQGYH